VTRGELQDRHLFRRPPWVYVHRQSRRLSEIVAALLLGSNNYIANQVFLEISGHRLQGAGICEHGQHGS
jgi:D-alanyl-D-alanine carboxypeptidase